MKTGLSNARRGGIDQDPTDFSLLEHPLDFIREDHMHMRSVCEMMERVSRADPPDPIEISRAICFLEHELVILIHDEDDDLRELLLTRCAPEDDIRATLERLSAEHETLAGMVPELDMALHSIHHEKRGATDGEATLLRDFADRLRRHLIVENAIVLPLARARLTEQDIAHLRNGMLRRRIEDMQA